ncbi:adenylate/guanylate cyclase domain-containing protein [Zooshikella ganghwensis]|uniref:adenylate/guanylate cyclase domain-containing protein n=1 Tax=Zooshikella ganghwensis TaxID=202772 RepID=UPI000481E341|nr:adenylate/guanylate cyclase domain-containing protein [Zooshikella ganghwensis]
MSNAINTSTPTSISQTPSVWQSIRLPIAYKLAFILTLTMTVGMAIMGTVITTNQYRLMKEQVDDFGTTIVNQLAAAAQEPLFTDDLVGLKVLTNNLSNESDIKGVAVYTNNGELMVAQGYIPQASVKNLLTEDNRLPNDTFRVEWKKPGSHSEKAEMVAFVSAIQFQDVVAGYAMVSFSQVRMFEVVRSSVKGIILTTVILSLLMSFIAIVMGRRLSRPIHSLMNAASEALSHGREEKNTALSQDELSYLAASMKTLAKGFGERSQIESIFSRFVSKSVATQLLEKMDEVTIGGGQQVEATVVFVDIVGFTSLSENMSPKDVAAMLNEYFSFFYECSTAFLGIVDKFIGDCAMVVFGTPTPDANHRLNAIAYAVAVQKLIRVVNKKRQENGLFPVNVRIGMNCGLMLAGLLGANERLEYTVIGDAVNLASRLADKAGSGQIIIPSSIYEHPTVKDKVCVQHHGSLSLKGKATEIEAFRVTNLTGEYHETMRELVKKILHEAQDQ